MFRRIFWPSLVFLALATPTFAAVDLVTLPTREGTQLTIYNSEDITMVREHRLLTVKEGVNRIQFSWANTLIDPTSIEFRILDQQDKVDLVDKDITISRRLKDQKTSNVVARQYKRRLDDQFVLYYDLIDYDETFFYEEELVSGKPVPAKVEVERQFDANVVLWGSEGEQPEGWASNEPGAYVDLHTVVGRVERVDQQHVKYFMDLRPGKKQTVQYSVTYKRRKVGPEINTEKKREPL